MYFVFENSVALTASEVSDRQVKSTHERQHLLQDIYRMETELESSRGEVDRLKNEILTLRDKLKSFHQQKLNADKRSTELLAMNSKLEASLEDFRQQYDKMVIDYEKMKRQSIDFNTQVTELKVLQHDYEMLKSEKEETNNQLTHYKTLHHHHEKTMSQVQEQSTVKYQQLEDEYQQLAQKLQYTLQQYEESRVEQYKYRKQYEDVVNDRDRLKTELTMQQSQHAEEKLQELKVELTQTVQEFSLYEEEKKKKEHVLTSLQSEYNKEKEKNILLSMQISLLEERMKVLNQELTVFRGIDVYHVSMQAELEQYRKTSTGTKGANTPSTAATSKAAAPTPVANLPYSNPMYQSIRSKAINSSPSSPKHPVKPTQKPISEAPASTNKFSLDDISSTHQFASSNKWGTTFSAFPTAPVTASTVAPSYAGNQFGYQSDDGEDDFDQQAYEANAEEKEREREARERMQRKAQREERLRQIILSQDKRKTQTPNTPSAAPTMNPAMSTPSGPSNLQPSRSFTIGESPSNIAYTRSNSINRALNRPASTSVLPSASRVASNPLASSRYTGDIERARRLLSM